MVMSWTVLLLAAPGLAQPESEKAAAFYEAAFDEILARSPMWQDRLGIHEHNDRWDDLSDAYAEGTLRILRRQLSELEHSIDYDRLDPDSQLSYELFVNNVNNRILALEWRYHTYPVEQMYGWQSRVPAHLISYHEVASVADAEAYIRRLERVDTLFEQVIEQLKIRAERGVIAPHFVFDHVVSDCRNVITGAPFEDGEDSTLRKDFIKKVSKLDIDEETRSRLIERADRALGGTVRKAYQALVEYVQWLQPQASTDDGAWKFPDGEAYYRYRLGVMTTTGLSADEVHRLGLREVDRIHDEMRAIMRATEFAGDLPEFFEFMRVDPQFYYPEGEEGREAYLAEAKRIIDDMRGRLDQLFGVTPKAQMEVRAVEPFREKSAGKAFYQRPAPDGSRPGVYYANLYRMSDMPTYQMRALAYHEGIPGHHMQIAISQELEGIPRFRKHARYTAYTEGWALYSELVPRELGLYSDPYSDFGRLAMELWRACRLVVDTGIHDRRWTREQAIEYLLENTPNPEGDAVKAIERYIVMPGQATAYKVGMIRIVELRAMAQEALAGRFDIREFHDVVLQNGPVPLDVLERVVEEWVAAKLEAPPAAP
jgi:uncharacterized protein (DUF885 family)